MKHRTKHVPTLSGLALITRQGDTTPRVSSLKVAEVFSKRHDNVVRVIHGLACDMPIEFAHLNFEAANYMDSQGKSRVHYLLTRDAFSLVAMGFTGREATLWKIRYIEAFNKMELAIRSQHALDGPQAPALIRQVSDFLRRLTPERRAEIRRAVRYQALGLTRAEIGRLLGCGPTKAGNLLKEHRWLKGSRGDTPSPQP